MATCAVCNSRVIVGGVRHQGHFFCNQTCLQGAPVLALLPAVPEGEVAKRMTEIQRADCPVCQRSGPLDFHESHTVWSALLLTSWKTDVRLSCAPCARNKNLAAAAGSFLLGWWGFPWGLIVTPIQVTRNMVGAITVKPSRAPSPRLVQRVRVGIARDMWTAGRTGTPPPLDAKRN